MIGTDIRGKANPYTTRTPNPSELNMEDDVPQNRNKPMTPVDVVIQIIEL